jgi:hypothetical protein
MVRGDSGGVSGGDSGCCEEVEAFPGFGLAFDRDGPPFQLGATPGQRQPSGEQFGNDGRLSLSREHKRRPQFPGQPRHASMVLRVEYQEEARRGKLDSLVKVIEHRAGTIGEVDQDDRHRDTPECPREVGSGARLGPADWPRRCEPTPELTRPVPEAFMGDQ